MHLLSRACGCLLGGAYGDSLGAAVEFMTKEMIGTCFPQGIEIPRGYRGLGEGTVTDDTQQALFVCRGIVTGLRHGGSDDEVSEGVWDQLRIWRRLQDEDADFRRSPGQTSMSSLQGTRPGTREDPLNESDSCGATMRSHPVGLLHADDPNNAFRLGLRIGALTHGHFDGYAPAGAYAAIISSLCQGMELEAAAAKALELLETGTPEAKGTISWLKLALASDAMTTEADFGAGAKGWDGDEALAIGVLAARKHRRDLVAACTFAAYHDGDSDTTASIAGALVGAMLGDEAIPETWRDKLEFSAELHQRAEEIVRRHISPKIR